MLVKFRVSDTSEWELVEVPDEATEEVIYRHFMDWLYNATKGGWDSADA